MGLFGRVSMWSTPVPIVVFGKIQYRFCRASKLRFYAASITGSEHAPTLNDEQLI